MAGPKRTDEAAQRVVEGGAGEDANAPDRPAAGPHAEKRLVDDDKTPGAGTVEEAGEDPSTDATTG